MDAPRSLNRLEPWVLAAACLLPTAVTYAYFNVVDGAPTVVQQAVYGVGKAVQFALPVVWVGLALRERLGFVRPTTRGLGWGLAFGLAVAVAAWLGYELVLRHAAFFQSAALRVVAKVEGLGIASPMVFIGVGVFYSLCHSLLEEYYWRWFVFRGLRRWMNLPAAVAVSSLAFMTHHVLVLSRFFEGAPLAAAVFSAAVLIGGVFWSWLYERSGSLFGPWMSHLLVDAAIFAVGYRMVFHG